MTVSEEKIFERVFFFTFRPGKKKSASKRSSHCLAKPQIGLGMWSISVMFYISIRWQRQLCRSAASLESKSTSFPTLTNPSQIGFLSILKIGNATWPLLQLGRFFNWIRTFFISVQLKAKLKKLVRFPKSCKINHIHNETELLYLVTVVF